MTRMIALVVLLVVAATVGALPFWPSFNPIGDARKAREVLTVPQADLSGGNFSFEIPEGEWNDLSITFWLRNSSTNALSLPQSYYQTTQLFYCPEPLQKALPDELDGDGGWGVAGGVDVVGSLVIPYDFTPHWSYTNVLISTAPHTSDESLYGAYTINAIVDTPMGVSLGGMEHVLSVGTNVFNSVGGPSDFVTITGQGNVQIGMSKLYWHEHFSRINGVEDDNMMLERYSLVTNEIVFVSYTLHLDAESHWTRGMLLHYDGNDTLGQTVTNTLPLNPDCRAFSSRGSYGAGLMGLGPPDKNLQVDIWDFRVHTWELTPEQQQQTFRNGKEELIRRGIPKRKGY